MPHPTHTFCMRYGDAIPAPSLAFQLERFQGSMHLISTSVTTVAIGLQSIGIFYQQPEYIVAEVAACISFFSMRETYAAAPARLQQESTCAQAAVTSFGGLLLGFRCSQT